MIQNMVLIYKVEEKRKKEEIWLSPMTKAPTPTEKSKKRRDNTKITTKNFDYTKNNIGPT